MASLAECSTCKGQVAKGARACPHCGKAWPAGMPVGRSIMSLGCALMLLPLMLFLLFMLYALVTS